MTISVQPWALWPGISQLLEGAADPKGRLDRKAVAKLPPLLAQKLAALLPPNKRLVHLRDAVDYLQKDASFEAAWHKAAGTGRSARTLSRAEVETIRDPAMRALTRQLWQMEADSMRRIDPPRVQLFHELDPTLRAVFGSSVTDICKDHCQDLDTLDYARAQHLLPAHEPLSLLHFDTHSDMYREPHVTSENIGTYINRLVADGSIDSFYWVVPTQTREDAHLRELFWDPTLGPSASRFNDGPASQTFWVDRQSGEIAYDEPPADALARYRTVSFHKVTLEELPSFADKKNVWVDIDADYFANTGNDTTGMAYIPYRGAKGLRDFAQALEAKGVRPALTTCALSPGYTVEDVAGEIRRFFAAILRNSATGDLLVGYHHDAPHTTDRDLHRGTTVPRSGCKAYELLAELGRIDAETYRPDGTIVLTAKSREGQAARQAAREVLGTQARANRALAELDAIDGRTDRRLHVDAIEEAVQRKSGVRERLERLGVVA